MKRWVYVLLSGAPWFAMGVFLLIKGLKLVVLNCISFSQNQVLFEQREALVWIGIGILIGFIKGRFVLIKSVERIVKRILSLQPFHWTKIYTKGYFLLIGLMMSFGVALNLFPISPKVHGLIDVAIGSALINGAMIFLRFALTVRKQSVTCDKETHG